MKQSEKQNIKDLCIAAAIAWSIIVVWIGIGLLIKAC